MEVLNSFLQFCTGIAPYRAFWRRFFLEDVPNYKFGGLAWLFMGVANSDAKLYDDELQMLVKEYPKQVGPALQLPHHACLLSPDVRALSWKVLEALRDRLTWQNALMLHRLWSAHLCLALPSVIRGAGLSKSASEEALTCAVPSRLRPVSRAEEQVWR